METPLSSRRITRSQTASSANGTNFLQSNKVVDSEKTMTKSRKNQQQDRALIDITNDSPIVGLAMGSLRTPSSAMSKKRANTGRKFTRTPGSGKALLRGKVKTLLQKVEEEAELSKITLERRPFFNLVNSPMNLVAPTPANTLQILSLSSNNDDLSSVTPVTDKFLIPQMMIMEMKQESYESETQITRSLLLDFSEKSDSSECSSVLTYQQGVLNQGEKVASDDDDASVWSIQVNASSTRDEEEEDYEDSVEDDDEYYDDEGTGFGENVDELCEGMSKISVVEEAAGFRGNHIRFVYNCDDEIEEEEVLGVLRLKGLPTPKGKHLRFLES